MIEIIKFGTISENTDGVLEIDDFTVNPNGWDISDQRELTRLVIIAIKRRLDKELKELLCGK